jgi:putative transposase
MSRAPPTSGAALWTDIRKSMKVADAQFVAKEFRAFVRQWQTSHVFTSPGYPQSNGKIKRFHRTLKEQAIRPKSPLTLDDARRIVGQFVDHYNNVRLHSAIGYVTPADKLAGRDQLIWIERKQKLETARELRAYSRKNYDVL